MHNRQTVRNRSALKRFSHKRRFQVALELLGVEAGERFLDYGTGDGYMLRAVRQWSPGCEVVGFEPEQSMYEQLFASLGDEIRSGDLKVTRNPEDLPERYFNKIACLEVFEHLTTESQRRTLERIRYLLRDDGCLVMSVPIEIGLSSLAKNMIRLAGGQPHGNTTPGNLFRSVLGVPIDRGTADYHYSHIGFDYRVLESVIREAGWVFATRVFSPIGALGSMLNSQVLYKLKLQRIGRTADQP